MSGVRNWAVGSAIAALVLLSPALAFLMGVAAEVVIDLMMEAGLAGICAVAAGVIGWVLFRRRSSRPEPSAQSGWERGFDEAAATAPPPM